MKIFSLPFSPYLSYSEYKLNYLPFVLKNKEFIYDIYSTIRITPFDTDAMGGLFDNDELIYKSLEVQKDTGIPVSATFNNTKVVPTLDNLKKFIYHFTPLYEVGIRSITMPIFHWMMTKEIQDAFPKLNIKNTIISEVSSSKNFWDMAKVGYDVVNIDRNLIRDFHTLKEIKKAQKSFFDRYNKYVKIQILVNEQCTGFCPIRNEHYAINFSGEHYFGNEISKYSCTSWEKEDLHYDFRRAVSSPFREDIDDLLKYVDLFKMFGRDGKTMLKGSMLYIDDFVANKSIVPAFGKAIQIKEEDFPKYDKWRKVIKTCKFQCWDCKVCDELEPLV
ncbi:MAG: hypothetical protein ACNI25_15255 [Halarcobacter sp.]